LESWARSGLSAMDWWMASAAWANSPSCAEAVELLAFSPALVSLSVDWPSALEAPPWLVWACVDFVLAEGEDGLFFWNTEAAPPARALSSPMTLPPNTPPEPLKVWAIDCGAK